MSVEKTEIATGQLRTSRKILFTNEGDDHSFKREIELPGKSHEYPTILCYRGRIYRHAGGGMTAAFYREVANSFVYEGSLESE